MPFCTSCGSTLKGTEKYCGECGSPFSAPTPSISPVAATTPPRLMPAAPPQLQNDPLNPKCKDCGKPIIPGKFYCDICQAKRVNPRTGTSAHTANNNKANRIVFVAIISVFAVCGLGVLFLGFMSNKTHLPLDSSGWSGTYGCVSTSGATQGMSYPMSLNPDASVVIQGIHSGIWYESEQVGETPKSDIAIQGITDQDGSSVIWYLHKSGSHNLVGHFINLSCSPK